MKELLLRCPRNYLKGMIWFWLVALLWLPAVTFAQSLASASVEPPELPKKGENQTKSLSGFIKEVEEKYQIYINYEGTTIEGKYLANQKVDKALKNVELNNGTLEKSLNGLLEPLELQFRKIDKNYYIIFPKNAENFTRKVENSAIQTGRDSGGLSGLNKLDRQQLDAYIQNLVKTLTGQITDENNEPLPGVNVVVKGTTTGTVTDVEGKFRLTVSDEATTLVISSVGFLAQEVTIGDQTEFNLALTPDIKSLSEVVVVGYGAVKKSDLTGSVSSISPEEITALPVNNVQQIMQGRAPGVQVIQNSHAPGGGISVRIRGANSILGGNDPLYVIDGFIGGVGLDAINPNDIESIEILKDASATAIYGSRGANGVVIVTTKRGAKGNDNINFDSYFGFQKIANTIDVMNARQFAEIANTRVLNDGGTAVPFPDLDNLPYDTDWQDAAFRVAPIQNYSLSFSGGDESTQYLISANYFDQTGIVENTDFGRGTLRANIDKKIGERFKISNSFQASRSVENNLEEGGDLGPISLVISGYPTRPIMEDNGDFAQLDITEYGAFSDPIENGIAMITQRTRESKTTRLFDMIYGELEIIEGLKAKVSLGVNYTNTRYDGYTKRTIPGSTVNGVASISNREILDILNENTLSYNKTFGDHSINAVAGFTSQRNQEMFFSAGARDFVTDVLETGDLSSGAIIDVPNSDGTIWSQQSVLGRFNYVLKDRYLFTVTGRYDGSSRVAVKNRWTFFPSFALGWRINEEAFMANMENISNMKVRVSWGQTGNDRIPSYLSQQRISAVTLSSGGQIVVGSAPANLPSSELDWEVTSQFDVGLDLGFFDERFRITADYYNKKTTNLLALVQLPLSVGFNNVIQNIGELKNNGFELGVGADLFVNTFKWNVEANFSVNRNEVTKLKDGNDVFAANLPGGASAGSFHVIREGETLASYYGYVYDGLDESGDLVYKDLNDDGNIDLNDRTILGDFFPDFIYGFNSTFSYKGIDLNVFLQGVQGAELVRLDRYRNANALTRGQNQLAEVADYWTPDNTDAKYPRPRSGINFRASDQYVEDASYLRLKNLQLGYNLPVSKWGAEWLRSMKVYVSGQNLLTLTKYTGYDPELNNYGNRTVNGNTDLRLGLDISSYPSARTYTVGVRVGL